VTPDPESPSGLDLEALGGTERDRTSPARSTRSSSPDPGPLEVIAFAAENEVAAGRRLELAAEVMGGARGRLTYQWMLDGAPIADAPDRAVYIVASAASWDFGEYVVRVTDASGSACQSPAVRVGPKREDDSRPDVSPAEDNDEDNDADDEEATGTNG